MKIESSMPYSNMPYGAAGTSKNNIKAEQTKNNPKMVRLEENETPDEFLERWEAVVKQRIQYLREVHGIEGRIADVNTITKDDFFFIDDDGNLMSIAEWAEHSNAIIMAGRAPSATDEEIARALEQKFRLSWLRASQEEQVIRGIIISADYIVTVVEPGAAANASRGTSEEPRQTQRTPEEDRRLSLEMRKLLYELMASSEDINSVLFSELISEPTYDYTV